MKFGIAVVEQGMTSLKIGPMSVMDYFRISARTFYILDRFSSLPYVPYAQPITSDYPNNIWLAVQITMLPDMQFPLVSCCHLQLTSNYILQHLTLNSLSVSSFVNMTDKVSHSYKTGEVIWNSVHFNLNVLRYKMFCTESPQAFPELIRSRCLDAYNFDLLMSQPDTTFCLHFLYSEGMSEQGWQKCAGKIQCYLGSSRLFKQVSCQTPSLCLRLKTRMKHLVLWYTPSWQHTRT